MSGDPRPWRVRPTDDGYDKLIDVSSGLCAETRQGERQLDVPLEPGTPITLETCADDNRLQRWQLVRTPTGFALRNAITQMVASIDQNGTVVQRPPDQAAKSASAWRLESDPECRVSKIDPAPRIAVTADECAEQLFAKAAAVQPTPQQVRWQQLERIAFLHFGVNTFTGLEWGYGNEDPDLFQPTELDTDQWAMALRDGGFKLAILTVKHHDGFVLYPSRYTEHDVASSTWQGGLGNVVRSFVTSLRTFGLKVGMYVSPADENQYLFGSYANGSARSERTIPTLVPGDDRRDAQTFTLPATDYGAYMMNQLYELLTEYGDVDEVWFDGAQGRIPPGRVEHYDWDSWFALIRSLAPDAVIAISGPDVRWVGNEDGSARENEWSVQPTKDVGNGRTDYAESHDTADQGSRDALLRALPRTNHLQWWPAESDVSIRPGWFYHAEESPKSVETLTDIYYRSVGRNSVLLLNVPPNRQGLLDDVDVQRLREFRARIQADFPSNLASGASGTHADLGRPREVDRIVLAEDIRYGQLVESAVVEARTSSDWSRVASVGTIGAKRIVALDEPVTAREWRVRVLSSRAPDRLLPLELYRSS